MIRPATSKSTQRRGGVEKPTSAARLALVAVVLCCEVDAGARAGGATMKITAIHTHYVRIPFDMGAPKQEFAGLRFPTMDHLLVQVETDAGITGWGEGFGHSIIPATKSALEAYVGPWFIGKDANRYQRPASRSRPGFPHLRPQRARGLRALRHRHRAVGHRRQTRGPTAVRSARRRTEEGGARLCQPHALRQSQDGRQDRWGEGRARLQAHQAARAQHRCRAGGARGSGSGHRPHERRQLPVERGAGNRDGARLSSQQPLLAGGAGVAARGPRRARPRAQERLQPALPPARTRPACTTSSTSSRKARSISPSPA